MLGDDVAGLSSGEPVDAIVGPGFGVQVVATGRGGLTREPAVGEVKGLGDGVAVLIDALGQVVVGVVAVGFDSFVGVGDGGPAIDGIVGSAGSVAERVDVSGQA